MLFFGGEGKSTDRHAGGLFDVGPGSDEECAGRSDFVQVAEYFDLKFALFEDVAFAGQVAGCSCQFAGIRVQGFMAVGCGIAFFIDVFERFQGPAGEVFAAVFGDAAEFFHVGPVFGPVSSESYEGTVRNFAVFFFVGLDVVHCDCVVFVFFDLGCDVNDAEGVDHIFGAKFFTGFTFFDKVPGEVDVCAELAGEFVGFDETFQHGVAPVEDGFVEFDTAVRDAGPVGTFAVQGVGEVHPFVVRFGDFSVDIPEFVCHDCFLSVILCS